MADLHLPEELRYDLSHLWVRTEGGEAVLGLTDYAIRTWGCAGFVQVPKVDTLIVSGEAIGQVSCATAGPCDLASPLSGQVTAVNEVLAEDPYLVNSDPYGEGWLLRVHMTEPAQLRDLLDAGSYRRAVEEPQHAHVDVALETIFQNSVDAMVLVDKYRRVLAMNPAAEALTGYKVEQVVGSANCYHLFRCELLGVPIHGPDCPAVSSRQEGCLGCTAHYTITRKDGHTVPVSASYSPIPQPGGSGKFLLVTLRAD